MKMRRLEPVVGILERIEESGMKESLEEVAMEVLEQMKKGSREELEEEIERVKESVEVLRSEIVSGKEFNDTKNKLILLQSEFTDCRNKVDEIEGQLHDARIQMTDSVPLKTFKREIESLRFSLRRIGAVEHQLTKLSTISDVDIIRTELEKNSINFNKFKDHIYEKYYTKDKTDELVKTLNKNNADKLESLDEIRTKNEDLMTQINKQIHTTTKQMKKDREIVQKLFNKFQTLATKEQIQKIDDRIDLYALKKDLKLTKSDLQATISTLSLQTLKTHQSLSHNQEIIARFDEIITQKASKFSLAELSAQLRQDFTTKGDAEKMEQQVEKVALGVSKVKEQIEEYVNERLISSKNEFIDQVSKKITKSYKKLKEDVKVKYKEENITTKPEIDMLLSSKVEREELVKCLKTKLNIEEHELAVQGLDTLHKQIKHICVILAEFIRQEISKYNKKSDSILENKKKIMTVMDQTVAISKWIDKFNPQVTKDLSFPQSLQNFQHTVQENLDSLKITSLTRPSDLSHKKPHKPQNSYSQSPYLHLQTSPPRRLPNPFTSSTSKPSKITKIKIPFHSNASHHHSYLKIDLPYNLKPQSRNLTRLSRVKANRTFEQEEDRLNREE
ncbi:unnamed protein product [Moneuplotes crassus]|uniref:Uncharacterized protein n=1 Tax=Euplotes crassus TaxID=5936 RepID=A0AAD2DC54_EUPCR|nr:unnamed protein product [Moneuplotes crassus]